MKNLKQCCNKCAIKHLVNGIFTDVPCECICHQSPQSKVKATCLSLDCPERTGGECRHQPPELSTESMQSLEEKVWFGDDPEQQNCPKAGSFGHWHCRPPQPPQESWEKLKEDLRDEFEDLFPKDQEAIDGIRPSKSNRSAGLVLWAKFELIIRQAIKDTKEEGRQMMLETVKELSKEKEEDIATSKQETEEKMYDMWYSGEVEKKIKQETLDEIVEMVEGMKTKPVNYHVGHDTEKAYDMGKNNGFNSALSDLLDKIKNIK